MTATAPKTAAEFVAEIRGNVDAWYAQPNTPETYAAFGERNRSTWQAIQAAGLEVRDEVDRILCKKD